MYLAQRAELRYWAGSSRDRSRTLQFEVKHVSEIFCEPPLLSWVAHNTQWLFFLPYLAIYLMVFRDTHSSLNNLFVTLNFVDRFTSSLDQCKPVKFFGPVQVNLQLFCIAGAVEKHWKVQVNLILILQLVGYIWGLWYKNCLYCERRSRGNTFPVLM